MKHWAAFGLLLSGITLWLPSNAEAEQGPPWTDAQCQARYKQLMEMMQKASDPKASDSEANLSELRMDTEPRSSFAKYCLKEAPSLKYLTRSVEDIEADRQETAGADSTTDTAGKQFEEGTKQRPDTGYTKF